MRKDTKTNKIMNKVKGCILFLNVVAVMQIHALDEATNTNISDINSEFILTDSAEEFGEIGKCKNFYNIKGHGEFLSKAKIRDNFFRNQSIGYSEWEMTFAHNWCKDDHNGIYGGVGISNYDLDWTQNPFFHRKNFPTVNFILGGFTTFFRSWFWQGGLSINVDARNPNLSDYTMYTLLAWGRYALCKNLGLHVGAVGWTGIKQTWLLPVLGLDYKLSDKISINLIFPINVSIVYAISEHWALQLNGKLIYNRHRVSRDEFLPSAIWQYRNIGTELALEYKYDKFIAANIHGGMMYASRLQISDSSDRHKHTYRTNATPYVGFGVDCKF